MSNKRLSSSKNEEDTTLQTDVSSNFINFFLKELRDVFWGEKHLHKIFKKMQRAALAGALKDALSGELDNLEFQLERLKQVFEILGEAPREKKSEAMAAMTEEARELIEGTGKGSHLRDTAIISTAQKIQHYKAAAYGTLIQLAGTMGNEDVSSLLEETLSEEKRAIELLNGLAEANADTAVGNQNKTFASNDVEGAEAVYDSINLTGKHTR